MGTLLFFTYSTLLYSVDYVSAVKRLHEILEDKLTGRNDKLTYREYLFVLSCSLLNLLSLLYVSLLTCFKVYSLDATTSWRIVSTFLSCVVLYSIYLVYVTFFYLLTSRYTHWMQRQVDVSWVPFCTVLFLTQFTYFTLRCVTLPTDCKRSSPDVTISWHIVSTFLFCIVLYSIYLLYVTFGDFTYWLLEELTGCNDTWSLWEYLFYFDWLYSIHLLYLMSQHAAILAHLSAIEKEREREREREGEGDRFICIYICRTLLYPTLPYFTLSDCTYFTTSWVSFFDFLYASYKPQDRIMWLPLVGSLKL